LSPFVRTPDVKILTSKSVSNLVNLVKFLVSAFLKAILFFSHRKHPRTLVYALNFFCFAWVRWVREFLNDENRGLDVLVNYLAFAQYAIM